MARSRIEFKDTVYTASSRAFPETDYATGEVKVDKEGMTSFRSQVAVSDGTMTEIIPVHVKAKENPFEGIPAMTPVRLVDAEISYGSFRDRPYWKLWAKGVEPIGAKKA